MSSPGGGGQNINLAALWIPVLPDTSHIGSEMEKAGSQAKSSFEKGFNSTGSSPEAMGASFTAKMNDSMRKGFADLEIPFGGSKLAEWFDKFGGEVDEKVVNKLKGQATDALRSYSAEHDKLAAAQDRVTESENKLNFARDNGFNKASIMIPLEQALAQSRTQLADQTTKTAAAHEQLTAVTGRLNEEQGKAATGGELMAGVMGGLVVVGAGLALKAVEAFADFLKEGLEEGIEITKELAEQTLELGEKYEEIGLGVREFSTASGEAFEELEGRAQKVFGTLDVAGANTGQTFAQLTSILGDAIPDSLVKHVEELQGRFSNLKAQDVAAIFYAFKVPAEETDSVLASLTESARGAGQGIGDLVTAMKGDASDVLHQAGLNAQQAGAFIADMMKLGTGGRSVLGGLQTVMKEAGKEGMSFGDGMKAAGDKLKELGDTAAGQDYAEKLFGTRRWAVAMQAAQDYVDVVAKGPDAFNQNSASLDVFLQQTETLENKWEEVKHRIEEALMPAGLGAVDLVDKMIGGIKTSFDKNLPAIKAQVKSIGDSFIDNLPVIQDFVAGGISLMGPLFDFIKEGALLVTGTLGGLVDIYAQVTGDDKLHESMEKFGEAQKKIQDIDFTKMADQVSSYVSGVKIDSGDIKKSFDAMWDSARGEGSDQQSPGAPIPDMTPRFDNGPHGGESPGAPTGAPGAPAAGAPGTPGGGTGAPTTAGPQGEGRHVADWDAIAEKESSNRWNEVLKTGITLGGGLQIKDDTWYQYGGLKYGQHPYQATKEQQEEIAERILNGWGTVPGQGTGAWNGLGPQTTYVEKKAKGGAPGRSITGGRGQGDDVAALLGRGEYVWDTETVDKYGWLIKALHQGSAQGFDSGGGTSPDGGILGAPEQSFSVNGVTSQGAQGDAAATLQKFAQWFNDNIEPIKELAGYDRGGHGLGDKSNHASGTALDINWDDFTALQGKGADARTHFSDSQMQAISQQLTAMNMTWGQYWTPGSRDPGHFELAGADYSAKGPQNLVGGQGVQAFNGSIGPGGYAGLPGQYGGSGVYGGETQDQMFSAQKAVQEANDRAADLDHDIGQQQKRISDLQEQLNTVGAPKIGLLGKPIPLTDDEQKAADAKKKSLQDQLDEANYSLQHTQRERNEQDANIDQAKRKADEAQYKKPSGTGQSGEGKAGETLGSGLLEGIGQELGFGDVFGKSPMDWGIVKLAEGLFKYANGLGDAIFGQTSGGMGGTPGGTQGLGGGMADGLLGSLGLKLPNASSISGGPNVIRPPSGSPASGQGSGAAPGPAVVNQDNSITVQAGVSDKTVVNAIKPQQDSVNSQAFQYTGGFPAS